MIPFQVSEQGRRFACAPAAVLVFIVDDAERILLLAHPSNDGAWEVVNGAVEAGESVLEAALRETREEAGPIDVRPLGTIHAYTYRFDDRVPTMTSIAYLLAFEGGEIRPGDDMDGSAHRWWTLDEIVGERPRLVVPRRVWLFERAIELSRLWRARPLEALGDRERH